MPVSRENSCVSPRPGAEATSMDETSKEDEPTNDSTDVAQNSSKQVEADAAGAVAVPVSDDCYDENIEAVLERVQMQDQDEIEQGASSNKKPEDENHKDEDDGNGSETDGATSDSEDEDQDDENQDDENQNDADQDEDQKVADQDEDQKVADQDENQNDEDQKVAGQDDEGQKVADSDSEDEEQNDDQEENQNDEDQKDADQDEDQDGGNNEQDVDGAQDEQNEDELMAEFRDVQTPTFDDADDFNMTPPRLSQHKPKVVRRRRGGNNDNSKPPNQRKKLLGKTKSSTSVKEPSKKKKRLQKRDVPETGVWVQCMIRPCMKWRYLTDITDPSKVPNFWKCDMNTDPLHNNCEAPEQDYENLEFVFNKYTEGSIVWAKMGGYPWWPAMVEEDPDYGIFVELDDNNKMPVNYHVVFLDQKISRAWLTPSCLQKFDENKSPLDMALSKSHSNQLRKAKGRAAEALSMSIPDRVKKFGFSKNFKGAIVEVDSQNSASQDSVQVDFPERNSSHSQSAVDDILDETEALLKDAKVALSNLEKSSQELEDTISKKDQKTDEMFNKEKRKRLRRKRREERAKRREEKRKRKQLSASESCCVKEKAKEEKKEIKMKEKEEKKKLKEQAKLKKEEEKKLKEQAKLEKEEEKKLKEQEKSMKMKEKEEKKKLKEQANLEKEENKKLKEQKSEKPEQQEKLNEEKKKLMEQEKLERKEKLTKEREEKKLIEKLSKLDDQEKKHDAKKAEKEKHKEEKKKLKAQKKLEKKKAKEENKLKKEDTAEDLQQSQKRKLQEDGDDKKSEQPLQKKAKGEGEVSPKNLEKKEGAETKKAVKGKQSEKQQKTSSGKTTTNPGAKAKTSGFKPPSKVVPAFGAKKPKSGFKPPQASNATQNKSLNCGKAAAKITDYMTKPVDKEGGTTETVSSSADENPADPAQVKTEDVKVKAKKPKFIVKRRPADEDNGDDNQQDMPAEDLVDLAKTQESNTEKQDNMKGSLCKEAESTESLAETNDKCPSDGGKEETECESPTADESKEEPAKDDDDDSEDFCLDMNWPEKPVNNLQPDSVSEKVNKLLDANSQDDSQPFDLVEQ